jgi:hypothetical protein
MDDFVFTWHLLAQTCGENPQDIIAVAGMIDYPKGLKLFA